ncbi:MAG: hypothetical protein JO147_12340, partial [Actinobacteria bacterium]|nr:hypothetical protein [Actinomycetota bacterium]
DADPAHQVIRDETRLMTADRFAQAVRSAARDLLDQGFGRGTVVALAAPTTVDAVVARYAAGLIGCTTVVCANWAG